MDVPGTMPIMIGYFISPGGSGKRTGCVTILLGKGMLLP